MEVLNTIVFFQYPWNLKLKFPRAMKVQKAGAYPLFPWLV